MSVQFSPEWIHRYYFDAEFHALADLLYGDGLTSDDLERLHKALEHVGLNTTTRPS